MTCSMLDAVRLKATKSDSRARALMPAAKAQRARVRGDFTSATTARIRPHVAAASRMIDEVITNQMSSHDSSQLSNAIIDQVQFPELSRALYLFCHSARTRRASAADGSASPAASAFWSAAAPAAASFN